VDASFEDFVRTGGPSLLRYAHLLCGDADRAEDLVQETLLKVHTRWVRGGAGGIDAPLAYSRRAVTNEYLSWRRRLTNHEVPAVLPDRAGTPPSDEVDDRDLVWSVIRDLPRRQRVVLVLRYYEDLPDREVAAVLGLRESSVRSLAARAFATLRRHPGLREAALSASAPATVSKEMP
jgi:RNA polymerase sigma-70 factor (sigma-E family)